MPRARPAVAPRKTPRQSRSAATCEAILEAAARILERSGHGGLTTNHVAELAGVSVGSLYQYFPSKEAIVAELIRRLRGELRRDLARAAASVEAAPLRQAVTAMVRASIEHHVRRPALARALEYAEPLLPLDAEIAELKAGIHALVADLLGAHGVADPALAAADLTALVRGMVEAAAQSGEADFDALAERVSRAACGYLGLPPARTRLGR